MGHNRGSEPAGVRADAYYDRVTMASNPSTEKQAHVDDIETQVGDSLWLDRLVDQNVYTPIRQGSAVAETVARLGQAIAVGLLRPGDQLPPEVRLADTLGISAVTLRSALMILRQGGLLETRRGRGGGTFVSARASGKARMLKRGPIPSDEELRDLVDYRCVVEGGAAALAAEKRTAEHIDELRKQIEVMDGTKRFGAWSEADTLFHLVLADASGCSRLVSTITELRVETQSIGLMYEPTPIGTMRHSNEQHREVLQAVEAHRPERAREMIVRHIQSTYDLWLGLRPALAPDGGTS
jgi:GntR family transcriptional regulator, transcriptional repressor for pyruvate dehydrogenase complex